MKSKYKKLLGNSLIFAVGNFGSKLMQFIMVPIYSYTLATNQFGKVDLLTSIISLLAPVVCLDIFDGVFRFALDRSEDKKAIFSTGFFFTLFSSFLVLLMGLFLAPRIPNYPILDSAFLLVITIFYSLISNFVRAIGEVKKYAISGIINTFVMGISNIVLLVFLHLGMGGYMQSMIVGQFVALLYLVFFARIRRYLQVKAFSMKNLQRISKYSVPLIPNGLAWWLNSTSDRFFISMLLGTGANGIYAMASKIPNVISTVMSIFFQSWQMSVVEEYQKKDHQAFVTTVFETFLSLLFFLSFLILGFVRPLFSILLSKNYFMGWQLTPWLVLAVIYTSIASFLGTMYTASKRTVPILITTIYGAVINVIATIVFIHIMGVSGAALANSLSFFIVSAVRFFDLSKQHHVSLNYLKFALLHLLYLIESLSLFIFKQDIIVILITAIVVVLQFLFDSRMKVISGFVLGKLIKHI